MTRHLAAASVVLSLAVVGCTGQIGSGATPLIRRGQAGLVELSDGSTCPAFANRTNAGFVTPMCTFAPGVTIDYLLMNRRRFPLGATVASSGDGVGASRGSLVWFAPMAEVAAFAVESIFGSTPLNRGEDEDIARRNAEWDACRDTSHCDDPMLDAARERYQAGDAEGTDGTSTDGTSTDGTSTDGTSTDGTSTDEGDSGETNDSGDATDDSGDSSTDDSGDSSADDSGDSSADDSGDSPADDSGDSSTDDSGDSSADDSGDSSADDPGYDDSGSDDSGYDDSGDY